MTVILIGTSLMALGFLALIQLVEWSAKYGKLPEGEREEYSQRMTFKFSLAVLLMFFCGLGGCGIFVRGIFR